MRCHGRDQWSRSLPAHILTQGLWHCNRKAICLAQARRRYYNGGAQEGRAAAVPTRRKGGKSEHHRARMPANGGAGRPDGKCHRNIPSRAIGIRVKWRGKSSPPRWQHRGAGQTPSGARPNRGTRRPTGPRVGCSIPAATPGLDRWLPLPRIWGRSSPRRT